MIILGKTVSACPEAKIAGEEPTDLRRYPDNRLLLLLYAVAYYFAYRFGMSFSPECSSPFWFPDSVLLCALWLSRPRWWALIILIPLPIRLLAPVSSGIPTWFLWTTFGIDSTKGILTLLALRGAIGSSTALNSVRRLVLFGLIAILLIPAGSAFAGATARQILGFPFWPAWEQWFLGNALTHLIVTPALFCCFLGAPLRWRTGNIRRFAEGGVLISGLLLGMYLAIYSGKELETMNEMRFYAPIPFLCWAAIRFGMRGASCAITATAVVIVLAAVNGSGFFANLSPGIRATALQRFLLLHAAPFYLAAFLIDQKKQVEATLRERELLHRTIFDSLTSLVAIVDRSGCIVATNDAWRRSAASALLPQREFDVGVNYLEKCRRAVLSGDNSVVVILTGIEDVLSGKDAEFQTEYPCVTPAGTQWFEMHVIPFRSGAGGVVISHRDVTLKKNDETELHQARQELVHLSRVSSLGALSSAIAHELNQPLGSILSNAQAASRYLQHTPPDLKEVAEILHDIVKEDQRAGEIIRRMRLLLKRGLPQFLPLDVNELLNDVIWLMRSELMHRGTAVDLLMARDLNAASGDQIPLQQVIINLLLNASDAMQHLPSAQRRLLVRTVNRSGVEIAISITDCGAGIKPEDIGRLFQPFFTTKKQGLGVGLAICKSIVDAHGGRLWAENNRDAGATFHLVLPCVQAGDTPPARVTISDFSPYVARPAPLRVAGPKLDPSTTNPLLS